MSITHGMTVAEAMAKVKENGNRIAGLKAEVARLRGWGGRGASSETPSFSANIDRAAGRITGEHIAPESDEPEQAVVWDRKTGTIRRL